MTQYLLKDERMNIKRLLCPIDFSVYGQAANEYASVLAKSTGATIHYLHSSLPEVSYGSYAYVDVEQEAAQNLKRLKEVKPTADGVPAVYTVEFGPPVDQIVKYAKENDIDLIVMGTHGRTGLRRVLMGSVAEGVVRNAECPVLAIKSDSKVLEDASEVAG